MAHHCKFVGNLRVDVNNNVVLDVYAHFKDKSELVYQICEDGLYYSRYIYYTNIAGYLVAFPGENISTTVTYWGCRKQENEDLQECSKLNLFILWENTYKKYDEILINKPQLKYLIAKIEKSGMEIYPAEFMDILKNYGKCPGVETLCQMGLKRLAMTESIAKLGKDKLREVCQYILTHKNSINEYTKLKQIQFAIKYKDDELAYSNLGMFHNSYKLFKYLNSDVSKISYYQDYINMCKNLGKNLKDKYWKYPKDLKNSHDKVMKELENVKMFEKQQKNYKFAEIGNHFQKLDSTIKGYEVYVARDTKDVEEQAKELNQCLITCDYISKVGRLSSLLVFIKKGGHPVATAELNYKKEILQFYGNESNRNDCMPSKEVKGILNVWLEKSPINLNEKLEITKKIENVLATSATA